MPRAHHYRRREQQTSELDMTTFMNLMVVLVPFLLITAVFSRITIVELTLPSASCGSSEEPPAFRVEVIVREDGLEISNGTAIIAAIPKVDEEYDFETLSQYMMSLQRDYSDLESASVLLEKDIPYDYLIQTMDVVRSAEVPAESAQMSEVAEIEGVLVAENSDEERADFIRVALFPNISIGEAP